MSPYNMELGAAIVWITVATMCFWYVLVSTMGPR